MRSAGLKPWATRADTMLACQPQHRPATSCGSEDLLARSYTLPPEWPFGAFHLVMETAPGTCDLYGHRTRHFCCELADGQSGEPETHVRQALASFLMHCPSRPRERPCRALDLGANNGWCVAGGRRDLFRVWLDNQRLSE